MKAEPFLKWAGGKRLLLEHLMPFAEAANTGRYFEPFLGGGALFFSLRPKEAWLSDINPDLIAVYEAVRDEVEAVIQKLSRLEKSESAFYTIRDSKPRSQSGRAARFIYLNKTCFNGLYRVNRKGQFNVPYGRHTDGLLVCDRQQLRNASAALEGVRLNAVHFSYVVDAAQEGDLVYFDPPYITGHKNNGFVEYNARVFSWDDQEELASATQNLVSNGVNVIVSNADHPSITNLYQGVETIQFHKLNRWSTMAARSGKRFYGSELVAVAGPAFTRTSC